MKITIRLHLSTVIITWFLTPLSYTINSKDRKCLEDSDCVANAYCFEGKLCLCKDRFIGINVSKKTFLCINKATSIGEQCLYDIQCTSAFGTHAECKRRSNETQTTISGRCDCKSDSHYQDGICYKNSRIGEACQVTDNCVIESNELAAYCDQSRCVCPPFYHANNDGTDCVPSSNLGGPCLTDNDCIIMNSRCYQQVCTCQNGYVMNEAKTHCLIAAEKLNGPCDDDRQCLQFLPRTICSPINRRCQCAVDSHEVNGACFKTSHLHEPCAQKQECLIQSMNLSRLDCYKGFCMCKDNYETVNRVDCIESRAIVSISDSGSGTKASSTIIMLLVYLTLSAH